jgi:hypothetical protein
LIYRDVLRRALLGAVLLLAVPAVAHHSSAMYDHDRTVTLKGAVREFQWTNPHCWIQLLVAGEHGAEEWSVQMGPPSYLYRDGWRRGTLKPGDEIVVVVNPMHDGSRGGLWVSGTVRHGS